MANQYRSVLAGAGGTGGDAVSSEVLSGKTFTNDNGPQTGTMTNNGAVSGTASPSTPYTIPEGYHNGSGTVTASNYEPLGYLGMTVGGTLVVVDDGNINVDAGGTSLTTGRFTFKKQTGKTYLTATIDCSVTVKQGGTDTTISIPANTETEIGVTTSQLVAYIY